MVFGLEKINSLRFVLSALACGGYGAASAAETLTYNYDVHGRLIAVVHAGSVNNGVRATYAYDAVDNRTNVTVVGSSNPAPS